MCEAGVYVLGFPLTFDHATDEAVAALPLILAAIVFVLGFNVTPLSKYALVVVVAVYPLGANNKGYVALEVVTVYVTFVSVLVLISPTSSY